MNENFKFSETRNVIEQDDLSENEIKTINNLGLTSKDLNSLLIGPYFAESSYALIFELPSKEQKVIAKVWKNPKDSSERAMHENVALRLLRMRGSKEAPQSIGYLKSATILFEEKIEGNPIENFDKNTINQLAETLAKIHSIELNAYGKPLTQRIRGTQMDCLNDGLEKLRENIDSSSGSNESMVLLKQAIDKIENEAYKNSDAFQSNSFTLVHFDLNRNNILQSKNTNKIILIDWEQASASDNAIDIAKLFLKLNFNEDQKNDFITEYEKGFPKKDIYFKDRLSAYEPFVLINSILWRLRVLKNVPESTAPTNEKEFYIRVKDNLSVELIKLKNYLSIKK